MPAVLGTPEQEDHADRLADALARAAGCVLPECLVTFPIPPMVRFHRSYRVNGVRTAATTLFVRKYQCGRCARLYVITVDEAFVPALAAKPENKT